MDSEKYELYSEMSTWNESVDHLYTTKDFSDVTLITGSCNQQASFQAHKWVLRMASPEFDRMICNLKGTPNDIIMIAATDATAVEIMISHIYKRKFQFSSVEQALNVLSLAIRYKLSLLKEVCENYIEQLIDAKNACVLYQETLKLRHEELFFRSFQVIQKETSNVLNQTDLKQLNESTLEDILKQDYLSISSEYELLQTVIKWAKVQLKAHDQIENFQLLREIVYPFLKYIRFLCFPRKTFLKVQSETRLFSHDEVGKIAMKYEFPDWLELPEWFNQMKACRRYKPDIKPRNISLYNWQNMSNKPYTHSECMRSIKSQFIAKSRDLFIRRFVINICEKCYYRNEVSKRSVIRVKVAARKGESAHEASRVIHVLPRKSSVDSSDIPDFYKSEPLIITKQFDEEKVVFKKYVGMEAPILNKYLAYDTSKLPEIIDTSSYSSLKPVDVNPPLYVKSGEVFSLTMERREGDLPFYCCRKYPLFDTAPFSALSDVNEEYSFVWCAFASVYYSIPEWEV